LSSHKSYTDGPQQRDIVSTWVINYENELLIKRLPEFTLSSQRYGK